MRLSILVLLGIAALLGVAGQSFVFSAERALPGAKDKDYRVGDRLPQGEKAVTAPTASKEINWDALIPPDWEPMKMFKALDLSKLNDSDPRAMEALDRLRAEWNNAPPNRAMNGVRVRIPGFVVPLENSRKQTTEFLLVPYFGACIHVPPPPSNQIIHVFPSVPMKNVQAMQAVWISGVLEVERKQTDMGVAGYKMKADNIEPYKEPAKR